MTYGFFLFFQLAIINFQFPILLHRATDGKSENRNSKIEKGQWSVIRCQLQRTTNHEKRAPSLGHHESNHHTRANVLKRADEPPQARAARRLQFRLMLGLDPGQDFIFQVDGLVQILERLVHLAHRRGVGGHLLLTVGKLAVFHCGLRAAGIKLDEGRLDAPRAFFCQNELGVRDSGLATRG
jgi:hypothetical protein